jgi:hypothetical protein
MHLEGFFVVLVWQAREEFAQADRQVSMLPHLWEIVAACNELMLALSICACSTVDCKVCHQRSRPELKYLYGLGIGAVALR